MTVYTAVPRSRTATPSPGTAAPLRSTAQALATATPASRDRYVDFLRVASITVVVVAHWVLALVVLDGTTALGHSRTAQLVTWALMVMPVFFAVGGFSHAKTLQSVSRRGGYAGFVASRTTRLLGPVVVMVAVWLGAAMVLEVTGAGGGPLELALDRIPTPLWFIAVYLAVVALAPLMHAAHRRIGLAVMAPLVAVVAVLDCLRYLADVAWAGPVNILVVWLAIHQLGFSWADGTLTRRGAPAVLAAAGLGTAAVLTVLTGWYPVDMQGLPGGAGANFAPPNLALLAHGTGLVGVVLAVRAPVTRWLQRPRPWATVVAGSSVIMTVFCWHLTAVFAVQGLVLLSGLTLPVATSGPWWALLPGWILLCLLPLTVLVAGFRGAERVPARAAGGPDQPGGTPGAVLGLACSALGLYVLSQVGLDGLLAGRTDPVFGVGLPAWVGVTAMTLGLALLRAPRR